MRHVVPFSGEDEAPPVFCVSTFTLSLSIRELLSYVLPSSGEDEALPVFCIRTFTLFVSFSVSD